MQLFIQNHFSSSSKSIRKSSISGLSLQMCVQFFDGFFLCCCQYLTSRSHAGSIHLFACLHLSGQVFDNSASDLCSSQALFTLDTRAPIHQRMALPSYTHPCSAHASLKYTSAHLSPTPLVVHNTGNKHCQI